MRAKARRTLANLKRLQLHLVQVNDLAALTEAAFHKQARKCLIRLVGSGKIDVPEIRTGVQDRQRVDKAVGLAIDFRHDSRAHGFGLIAIEPAAESDFLARKELLRKPYHPTIAADEQRLRTLAHGNPGTVVPRRFNLHLQADTVALTNAFGNHGKEWIPDTTAFSGYHARLRAMECALVPFVVLTNSAVVPPSCYPYAPRLAVAVSISNGLSQTRAIARKNEAMTKVITILGRSPVSHSRLNGVRDRRYTIRYPFAADAELIDMETGKQVTGVTSDLSLGGCFICTSKPLPVSARARLRLNRKGQTLETLVIVRIVKPRIGLGIEFFDLEPPNHQVLSAWIESLQRKR